MAGFQHGRSPSELASPGLAIWLDIMEILYIQELNINILKI